MKVRKIIICLLVVVICFSTFTRTIFASGINTTPQVETYRNLGLAPTPRATVLVNQGYLAREIWKQVLGESSKGDIAIDSTYKDRLAAFTGKLDLSVLDPMEYVDDLTEIKYLTNVSELNLTNTYPDSIDLQENIGLKKLVIKNNDYLQSIDLSANVNLEELDIAECGIGTLDLRANTKIKKLNLKDMTNRLKNESVTLYFNELLLGEKPDLTTFNLSGGALTKLDLSGAPNLTSCTIAPQFAVCGMAVNGDWSVNFDMKSLVGVDGLSKINEMFIKTTTGDTYDSTTGKLFIDGSSDNSKHPDDTKNLWCYVHYTYQTGASISGNPILLETYVKDAEESTEYTVTFKDLNGNLLKTVDKLSAGASVTPPAAPARAGYDFKGWDQNIDYVVKTMDVYPIYEVKATTKVNVTFKDFDGTELKKIELLSGSGISAADVPNPTHEGLTFLKWDKAYNKIEADTTITAIYEMPVFKDQEFRKIIWEKVLNRRLNNYDVTDTTYKIYTSDLMTISSYNDSGKVNLFLGITTITSLNGIEYFKSLDYLSCPENPGLKNVDLSKNKALKHVGLRKCSLETLILGDLPDLRMLWCEENNLTKLDVSGCPKLGFEQLAGEGFGELSVDKNKFEYMGLKLGNHPYLKHINMRNNPNQGIVNVQNCPELLELYVTNTGITAINVTNNLKLKKLDISYNNITNLDVTKNRALQNLWLTGGREGMSGEAGNNVAILNLTNNPELYILDCSSNGIASLDITTNTKLGQLYCGGNELTSINLAKASELTILDCSTNKLNSIDVSSNLKLETLLCSSNTSLSVLDLKKNVDLKRFECNYNSLKELDLSRQSKLKTLVCIENQLYRVDLHSDAFKDTGSVATINPQKSAKIFAEMDSTLGQYAYNIEKLVGTTTGKTKITMLNLSYGSYDNSKGQIVFNSYDTVVPFLYQYSTGNTTAPQLQIQLTPEFGDFFRVKYYDGTNLLKEIDASENSKLLMPLDIPASRTGWDFVGWYKESELVNQWNFLNDTLTNDTSLYAKWVQKEYKIEYETGTTPIPSIEDAKYGDKLDKPSDPIIPGQEFDGWYKDDTYQNTWDFDADIVTNETVLYAKWNNKHYKVKYDTLSQESAVAEKSGVLYKDNNLLPSELPRRTGYDFNGWGYQGKTVIDTTKYEELVENDGVKSITLNAIWNPHLFTVHYTSGYQDVIVVDKNNVTWDDANLLPQVPIKHGYQFKSWKLNGHEVTSNHKYSELTTDSTTGTAITLIAEWEERQDYSVIFNPNNGVLPEGTDNEVSGLKYTSSIQLPTPTREGYIFKGWMYQDIIVNDSALYSELDKNDTANVVELKAQWKAINYTVTFEYISKNIPDGIIAPKVNVDYGQKVSQPVLISLENWIFDGWYINKECTQKYDFNTEIKSDITLYGNWTYVEPKKPGSVDTGDNNYMLNFLILALSTQVIVYVYYCKKKQKNSN